MVVMRSVRTTRAVAFALQIDGFVCDIVAVNDNLTDRPALGNAGDIEREGANHAGHTKRVVASALHHPHAGGVAWRTDVGAQSCGSGRTTPDSVANVPLRIPRRVVSAISDMSSPLTTMARTAVSGPRSMMSCIALFGPASDSLPPGLR